MERSLARRHQPTLYITIDVLIGARPVDGAMWANGWRFLRSRRSWWYRQEARKTGAGEGQLKRSTDRRQSGVGNVDGSL